MVTVTIPGFRVAEFPREQLFRSHPRAHVDFGWDHREAAASMWDLPVLAIRAFPTALEGVKGAAGAPGSSKLRKKPEFIPQQFQPGACAELRGSLWRRHLHGNGIGERF